MKEVDCRKCKNCTGRSCKKYGPDAKRAVKDCAADNFKNYKVEQNTESFFTTT